MPRTLKYIKVDSLIISIKITVSFVRPTVVLEAYILPTGHGQYIFHHRVKHNPDCIFLFFLRIGPVAIDWLLRTMHQNNQSDDLLFAQQWYPQGNEVLRDTALIRSFFFLFLFCFFFDNLLILSLLTAQVINTMAAKLRYFHQETVSLHHPCKRTFLSQS